MVLFAKFQVGLKMFQMNEKTVHQLQDVRQWANDKIAGGQEPPWAWYQYMKLVETIDAILSGAQLVTTENSPQLEERRDAHLRLVGSTYQQDDVQPRPSDLTVQMPM